MKKLFINHNDKSISHISVNIGAIDHDDEIGQVNTDRHSNTWPLLCFIDWIVARFAFEWVHTKKHEALVGLEERNLFDVG